MTPEAENSRLKLALAFVLGISVAGLGAWALSGRPGDAARPEPSIAVAAPAVEVPASPSEPEPDSKPAPVGKRLSPAPVQVARNVPAPAPPPPAAAPAQETPKPEPIQPQAPALPEIVKRDQPKLDAAPPPPPPPPAPSSVTIKAGTVVNVRLAERITTETAKNNDTFSATLAQPIVVDGMVIAERNARVSGRIVQSERAGKVQGKSALSLELTQFTSSDGQKVQIQTGPVLKQGESSKKDDAKKVAIGSALGAAIGAIAGGGKGAAIGAGAGAGAGGGAVVMTRGKEVELNVETPLSFTLSNAVTLTEKVSN